MQRARILVRLHADQADKTEITVGAHLGDDAVDAYAGVGFVDGDDVDIDIGPEHFALRAIVDQAVDGGQRIRRHRRAEPADDIAVVVVMRRLYQDHAETLARAGLGPRLTRLHAGPVPDRVCCSLSQAAMHLFTSPRRGEDDLPKAGRVGESMWFHGPT